MFNKPGRSEEGRDGVEKGRCWLGGVCVDRDMGGWEGSRGGTNEGLSRVWRR